MNKEQRKLFEMLKEFDGFCKENDISYCLAGETLLYGIAAGSIQPRPSYASVFMTGDACRKFINAFEAKHPENRELEYWGNSAKYPDYTVRYIASDTTAFNIVNYLNYEAHGMYIEIIILRGENHKRKTLSNLALERGIMINSYNESTARTEIKGKRDIASNGYFKTVSTLTGKKRLRKQLFEFFSKECVKPSSQGKGISGVYTYFYKGKKYRNISRNYFDMPVTCEIEGYSFPAPRNSRTLLSKMFADRYRCTPEGDQVDNKFGYADNSIVDVDTPYRESIRNLNLKDEDFIKIFKSKERIDEINKKNRENNAIAKNDWQTVLQTGARFRMWKQYMPMKEEILRLRDEGNYRELERIFADYKDELDRMNAQKRSVSFDNEIFDAFISTLEHYGQFRQADEIIRYLPVSHLKDIEYKPEKED